MQTVLSLCCYKHSADMHYALCIMTLETVTLFAFLSVNLKVVIFLALPILPSHVSPLRLRITFLLHMARYKFLYCTV